MGDPIEIEGTTLTFGLPYVLVVKKLDKPVSNNRRRFSYSLRYVNQDFARLGPEMLIREKEFKTLLDNIHKFPSYTINDMRYSFWLYHSENHINYWELLKMIANFECLCPESNQINYRDTAGVMEGTTYYYYQQQKNM
ncbi:hypothetical protein [Klebsiella aerogenes]|uniref:hypothetical protein n=1 Tax=Klebsiella aerogenes TaxID=548 RepID=UPI001F30960C|nr:hypothetical protein [Klebsiella aerogenes]